MNTECKILSLCKGTELVFCTDGSYTLRHTGDSAEFSDTTAFSLIQCYSNGCVNKVSIDNLIALRYDYKYSHGIYPLSNLLASSIVSAEDSICVKYIRNGSERSVNIDVQTIRSHSMLGLKGIDIIRTTFDEVTGWYLNGGLICDHLESMKPIDMNMQTISENLESVTPNGFSVLTKIENKDDLEETFREFKGRNIPVGQQYAKEVLARCQTKDEFWNVIRTLLKCNTRVYRSPVLNYLNEYDITQFMPSVETLLSICELLFAVTAKPEKNLEFLYHFKDILSDEIKEKIVRSINSLSQPEQYFKLCDTLGMSINECIEYCIEQANTASYYCVYEMLLKVRKNEGYFAASKLVTTYINKLDESSIKGVLIKYLIYNEFNIKKKNLGVDMIKIKSSDYNEYSRICTSYEGKKKAQTVQNSITSNVGKKMTGRYVATYSNHYLLVTSNGVRILLPKSMSEKVLREGESVNVQIVYADKKYNTLYATQKTSVDYIKIMQMPLLNNGDVIEISFDSYGNPVPHKCYKKIQVYLESYPKEIENKTRYEVKVIHQTKDRYHYLVKIIK